MNRTRLIILILTMPFWLAMAMILWAKNPLFILVPCGLIALGLIAFALAMIYAAELRTRDDWDLVIRSILLRLGFNIQAPKSLMQDIDINNPEHWHHHHHDDEHHQDSVEKDNK